MMRYVLMAGLMLVGLTAPLAAAPMPPKTESCSTAADARHCEDVKKDFLTAWPKAHQGDYQSQRTVAFCLLSGCSGALKVDHQSACAWATVIVATDYRDNSDVSIYQQACRTLSPNDRAAAINAAMISYGNIYKKLMSKKLPYEPAPQL